jgi:hypothetical protein
MFRLHAVLLSSALLLAPLSVTAAFAQSSSASSNAAPTTSTPAQTGATSGQVGAVSSGTPASVMPPAKNGAADTGTVRQASPDSASAQLKNPTGAQPGTGSGMGKVSGTAAGN